MTKKIGLVPKLDLIASCKPHLSSVNTALIELGKNPINVFHFLTI